MFYVQLDNGGYIKDCITYEHEGYKSVMLDEPLPGDLLGGWYRLDGNQLVYDREKYEEINEIGLLSERVKGALAEAMAIVTGEIEPENDEEVSGNVSDA